MSLLKDIEHSKLEIIKECQKVYDEWDESDIDTYANGGICHYIADEILTVLDKRLDNKYLTTYTYSDVQHVVCVVGRINEKEDTECYIVDIPYWTYEKGAGYNWEKIQNVKFNKSMIEINPVEFENFFDEKGNTYMEKYKKRKYKEFIDINILSNQGLNTQVFSSTYYSKGLAKIVLESIIYKLEEFGLNEILRVDISDQTSEIKNLNIYIKNVPHDNISYKLSDLFDKYTLIDSTSFKVYNTNTILNVMSKLIYSKRFQIKFEKLKYKFGYFSIQEKKKKKLKESIRLDSLILSFLKILNQILIFHWQTRHYSEHIAFKNYYESMQTLIDSYMESYQGKRGRIYLSDSNFNPNITINDYSIIYRLDFINEIIEFLNNIQVNIVDSELVTIVDEMKIQTNKLKYMLSLKEHNTTRRLR